MLRLKVSGVTCEDRVRSVQRPIGRVSPDAAPSAIIAAGFEVASQS